MRFLRSIALISCFVVVPALFAQAVSTQAVSTQANDDWRFAHPGATLVGGFHVKATLDSPLVNTLIKEATSKDPSAGMMVGMVRSAIGGISDVRFSVKDMGK